MEDVLRRCAQNDKIFYGYIPLNEGESFLEYFTRLLDASYKDEKFYLLLCLQCDLSLRDEVLDDFRRAQDIVRAQH